VVVMVATGGFNPEVSRAQDADQAASSETPVGRWALVPEGHFALVTNQIDRATLALVFGGGLNVSRRVGQWGFFGRIEQNSWLVTELESCLVRGVVNIGFGVERLICDGFVRISVAGGVSVLAFDSELDAAVSLGIFADFRPLGLRWRLSDRFVAVLDPMHFVVISPIIDQPYLTAVQYRTSLSLEFSL